MGSGCAICKRDGINDPKRARDIAESWKSQASKPATTLIAPNEFMKPVRSILRRNDSSQNNDTPVVKKPTKSEQKMEDECISGDSWVAVARRDNSGDSSSGKSSDSPGGVLIEFKAKRGLPPPETKLPRRKTIESAAADSDGGKNLMIKRLLTPCFDQNETASFGNRTHNKDTEDYNQSSRHSESPRKELTKEDSLQHNLQKKMSRFSASSSAQDSIVTVSKCAPHSDVALAQGREQAGTNDSQTIQRGSSLSLADFVAKTGDSKKPISGGEEGDAVSPNENEKMGPSSLMFQVDDPIEEAKKEEELKEEPMPISLPKRLVVGRRSVCQRVVKAMDQERYQTYKQKVMFKNVLKEAPPLGLIERKETNTKVL